jgi:hypothetical protein
MTKYKVRVIRCESKAMNLYVEAEDINQAKEKALELAENKDFSLDGSDIGHSFDVVETKEL